MLHSIRGAWRLGECAFGRPVRLAYQQIPR